jgi:hypothetical protein
LVWAGAGAQAEQASLPPFVGTEVPQDDLLEVIATADSRSFKAVGHTSVVLRMRTVARVTAALNVRSRTLQTGYRHEIAAYRIARLLSLDNVPPAVFRRATWKEIQQRFHEDQLGRRGSIRRAVVWDEDGSAPGAAIYWVKGLRSIGSSSGQRWRSWLRDGDIPDSRTAIAKDLSTMILFDFLIGNWDRFSGGNVSTDPSRQRVVIRDNDRAFSTPLLERRYRTLLEGMARTERFSESVVRSLAALDEVSIRDALAEDPSHASSPLLNDDQIADVLDRKATILSYIAALIDEHGEDRVLFFP